MLGGIGIGLLSGAGNKKIVAVAGAVLIAIGIAGMIAIGSQASEILTTRGEFGSPDLARSYFYSEYVFMSAIVGGLVLLIFGLVSMQGKKSPAAQ
ncbi:MAG TPA: hypothetical protein VMJ94_07580 [Nitrososphaera sp.]|nr:hypothetical protein [Nitrososphaera sp.]